MSTHSEYPAGSSRVPLKRVIINQYGRTGNNIMEHMCALYIKSLVPDVIIYSSKPDLLGIFGITLDPEPLSSKSDNSLVISINNSKNDIHEIIERVKKNTKIKVIINYNLFDVKYMSLINDFKLLYGNKCEINGFDEKHIVINIRLGDIATPNRSVHPNYPVVPFSFHKFLIKKTGLIPVFLGQLDDGVISKKLFENFPNAKFIKSRGIIQDFECLRRSKNLSVSVSTFSYLTALLSEDSICHIPLYGIFNRKDRPDLNFIYTNKRFHYYEFPQIHWENNQEQIRGLLNTQWESK